jgi:hypothetical protein
MDRYFARSTATMEIQLKTLVYPGTSDDLVSSWKMTEKNIFYANKKVYFFAKELQWANDKISGKMENPMTDERVTLIPICLAFVTAYWVTSISQYGEFSKWSRISQI